MTDQKWLDGLQVGEEVWFPPRFPDAPGEVVKVVRKTSTQLVLANGWRVRIKGGKVMGSTGYYTRWAHKPTDDAYDKIERFTLAGNLKRIPMPQMLPAIVLRKMLAPYEEYVRSLDEARKPDSHG